MYLSLTSLPHVLIFLLAHLTLVTASDDSLVATEPKLSRPETCFYQVAGRIAHHLSAEDAAHFSMACREIGFWSAPSMQEHRKKFFVGDNPSYIQAVRRCMHGDDVICFKYVKRYFEKVKKVEPHQLALVLAQLPHLAAKLNAPNIFKELNIDKGSHQYRQVLIRAYLQRREKFISQIGDIKPMRGEAEKNYNVILAFLSKEDAHFDVYSSRDLLYHRYQNSQNLLEFEEYYRRNRFRHPKDFVFVTRQRESCPSITEIVDALNTQDLEERGAKIAELKTRIDNVLQQGVYIMDDIVLNIGNTVYLWWKYAQPLTSALAQENQPGVNDGGASEFVYWLIDQGAPMDEMHLLSIYTFHSFESYDQSRFRELARVWTLYGSGGPTKSLIGALRAIYVSPYTEFACGKIQKSLPLFHAIGADIFNTRVLWPIALRVTDSNKVTEECHRDIMVWYANKGLKKAHLNVLQGPIPAWLPAYERENDLAKERFDKAVLQWMQLTEVLTLHDSGESTMSLITFLHYASNVQSSRCPAVRKSLPQYREKGADMFDTRVLWLIAFLLTDFTQGTEECQREIMVWYANNGLEKAHLNLLQGQIPSWLPADKLGNYEERFKGAVFQWKAVMTEGLDR